MNEMKEKDKSGREWTSEKCNPCTILIFKEKKA
jgi:hypothetical protein